MSKTKLSGWGNFPFKVQVDFISDLKSIGGIGFRGNGRSYGDVCVNEIVYQPNQENCIKINDGVVEVSSDIKLRNLLHYLWRRDLNLSVIPGTAEVTIGGMVANDVHGKNHDVAGSFGAIIQEILLDTGNLERWINEKDDPEIFRATIGGIGLTGFIKRVKLKLEKLNGKSLEERAESYASLDMFFNDLMSNKQTFKVGWMDIKRNKYVLKSADYSPLTAKRKTLKLNIPKLPFRIPRDWMMHIYNWYYFRKTKKGIKTVNFESFYFPLDGLKNWNNLYGSKGFIQLQFLIPSQNLNGLKIILHKIRESKFMPYLVVTKYHGNIESKGELSFVKEGFSVALDYPLKNGLIEFIHSLHAEIVQYQGRVYLAKDSCCSLKYFKKMYNVEAFQSILRENDLKFTNNLAKRLKIVE